MKHMVSLSRAVVATLVLRGSAATCDPSLGTCQAQDVAPPTESLSSQKLGAQLDDQIVEDMKVALIQKRHAAEAKAKEAKGTWSVKPHKCMVLISGKLSQSPQIERQPATCWGGGGLGGGGTNFHFLDTQGEIKWSLAEKGTDVKGKFDSAAGGGTYMVDTLVGDEECNYAGVWKIADGQSGFFALCDKNQPPAEAGSD
eukprot:TRINITY_DN13419_c0_g1_i2.p1 TRINITY_DN13419_c0_g1~~TRINITY_DN13419_c0_g1_i2.p1  ORF type:complete len:226 (-),score=36.68 TRINITY_DN13419_c0_g1_i2:201-797(-)